MKDINKQIGFIIVEIVLILAIVTVTGGYAFGYITPAISKSEVITSDKIQTMALNDTETLEASNIMPGWESSKNFSITNEGDSDKTYNVKWVNVVNEFVNKQDLIYTITDSNGKVIVDNKEYPTIDSTIQELTSIYLKPGATHEYTLKVKYVNAPYNQNADMGKTFGGKLNIEETK